MTEQDLLFYAALAGPPLIVLFGLIYLWATKPTDRVLPGE
jgi:hypothetical protein